MSKSRETTEAILEAIEAGALDRDTVIMACLKYMSEDDVTDMARANEFFSCPECSALIDPGEQCECTEAEDES